MQTVTTRATRATRPLIEYPTYYERDYCPECMHAHMIEKTRSGRVICQGENFYFETLAKKTHYARRLGKGFELVPLATPRALPLEWQMAEEEREYIDVEQDW